MRLWLWYPGFWSAMFAWTVAPQMWKSKYKQTEWVVDHDLGNPRPQVRLEYERGIAKQRKSIAFRGVFASLPVPFIAADSREIWTAIYSRCEARKGLYVSWPKLRAHLFEEMAKLFQRWTAECIKPHNRCYFHRRRFVFWEVGIKISRENV